MHGAGKPTLLFVILIVLFGCGQRGDEDAPTPSRPVKITVVEDVSDSISVNYPAIVAASDSTNLTFQVGGLVNEVVVIEGQSIKKGDLIAAIDKRDYQNNFNSAKAQYDNARTDFERAAQLLEQNAVSKSVYDQRLSQRDIARASYETAKKALSDTELRAPFDGVVAAINIDAFQNVSAQEPVITLQSDGNVEAIVNVPAQLIARVPELLPADTTITLDSAPNLNIPATLKEAAAQADPASQTYTLRFAFTPPENLLILPGMTGVMQSTLRYLGDELNQGVAIPATAILAEGDNHFVWVLETESMTVSKRAITLAPRRWEDKIVVVEGLETGEQIAAAGVSYLYPDMAVTVWSNADQ